MNTQPEESLDSESSDAAMPEIVAIRQQLQRSFDNSELIDLTSLKLAVSLLPDHMPKTASTQHTFDEIHAVLFHSLFPLRSHLAEEWLDKYYIPTRMPVLSSDDKEKAIDLLSSLGLVKPKSTEPIRRI